MRGSDNIHRSFKGLVVVARGTRVLLHSIMAFLRRPMIVSPL